MTIDPGAPTGTAFSPSQLADHMLHRRAVQAVVWGMPAVNYRLMYQAAEQAGAGFNQILYWPRLLDWRNQTLTPNPDVIYLMPFISTKDVGPVVLEIPAAEGGAINGSVMNYWQAAIEDVGPAGVDQGKGGRYLILPPGHQDPIPDGYLPLPCDTYQGFALLRSILQGGSQAQLDQPSSTPSASGSIRCRRPPTRPRPGSWTPARACSTRPSPMTCGSSRPWIRWCRPRRGWSGIG
jgi:hypothetical protein